MERLNAKINTSYAQFQCSYVRSNLTTW